MVVLENGRPLVVADWIDHAPTVLEAWHGGTEASAAIVDVLLGDEEPAGRLPMSFPRSVGQIPMYYAHERTGRPATAGGRLSETTVDVGLHGPDNVHEKYTSKYLDLELGPQFTFGHGSGYAAFSHGLPRLSEDELTLDDLERGRTITVEVDVTNTSDRRGDQVVQAYLEDVVSSVAPPVRRLVAFERRTLDPGETVTVSFELATHHLGFWATDAAHPRFIVEPGLFRLHVGGTLEHSRPSSSAYADGPAGRHRVSGWAGTSCRGSRGSMTAPGVSSCHRRVLRAGPPDRPSTPADDAEAKGMRVPGNTRAVHRSRFRRASVAWSPGRTPVGGHDHDRSQAPQAARPRTHAQDR